MPASWVECPFFGAFRRYCAARPSVCFRQLRVALWGDGCAAHDWPLSQARCSCPPQHRQTAFRPLWRTKRRPSCVGDERQLLRSESPGVPHRDQTAYRPSRRYDRLVPYRFSEPKSIRLDQRERLIASPLSRIHKGGLAWLLQIPAILIDHPMRALVPYDNHILLTNPSTATAPGPPQDLVAVLELGKNLFGLDARRCRKSRRCEPFWSG